jgi:1-acyl-sn-glycerol-3-phosphate acyltransferase
LGGSEENHLTPVAALLYPGSLELGDESIPIRALRHILSGTLISTARIITGADAHWVGCKPSETPRIYVVNHTSHADFILLLATLPPQLRTRTLPVGAAEYWNGGAVPRFLANQVFRAVLIDRDRVDRIHNPLAPMLRALDRGNSLIVFPEGTRGPGKTLLPFKCGLYHLANARPDIELVPVWIDNLYRVLPRGAIIPAPVQCSATFGAPTRLAPGEDKQQFLGRLRQSIAQLGESC